jgi:uncharacterized protein (TIGR03545 family)
MKRWIRWQGLIGFLVVVGLLGGIWFFLVDAVVKAVIESTGTRVIGARVELEKADLGLIPLGLSLRGLAVTDVDKPMRNALEIAQIDFLLDVGAILRRKVIVNKMTLDGVRFATPRKRSGAIQRKTKPDKEEGAVDKTGPSALEKALQKSGCKEVALPSFSAPDIERLLAQEALQTVSLAKKIAKDVRSRKNSWEQELANLPDEKRLDDYRIRIEKLSGKKKGLGDVLGAANDAVAIQKDLDRDMKRLKGAKKGFDDDLAALKRDLTRLKESSRQDIERLKKKYTISSKGLANMSMLIFGESLCGGIQKAHAWGQRLWPYIGKLPKQKGKDEPTTAKPIRGRGLDVRFPEQNPLPDLLVRLARAQVLLDAGELAAKIENLTTDQRLTGVPTTFNFLGREMRAVKSINGQGSLNFMKKNAPRHTLRLAATDYQLVDISLRDDATMPLTISKALADFDLTAELAGPQIDATLSVNLDGVALDAGLPEDGDHLMKTIADTLVKVDRFQVSAVVGGSLEDLTVRLTSDLDRILKGAAGDLIRKEGAKLEAMIRRNVRSRVQGPTEEAQGAFSALEGITEEITGRLSLGDDLLKNLKAQAKLPF